MCLFPLPTLQQHTTLKRYYESYYVLLPVCMAVKGVEVICKYCGRIFVYDWNSHFQHINHMSTLQFLNPKVIRPLNYLLLHTVVIQQGKHSHPGPLGISAWKFYSCSAE